jgi:hypothetical protein
LCGMRAFVSEVVTRAGIWTSWRAS